MVAGGADGVATGYGARYLEQRPGWAIVNFPKHHGGRHVPVASSALPSCPQVMGAFALQANAALPRPCQSCALCLPAAIST